MPPDRPASTPAYSRQPTKNGRDLAFVLLDGQRFCLGRHGTPASRARYHQLIAEEVIPPTIHEGLRAVAGMRHGRCGAHDNLPVQPVPKELIHPVKWCVTRQVAAMIDLQLLTGARPGEHKVIVDRKTWDQVPRIIAENGSARPRKARRQTTGPWRASWAS